MPKMEMRNFTVNPNPKWVIVGKLVKCMVQWERKYVNGVVGGFKLGPYLMDLSTIILLTNT